MKRRRFPPTGPFAPPTPSQVDAEGAEPMAVARDKTTPFDNAMPTTASHDSYAQDAPGATASEAAMRPHANEETRKAERPEGYSGIDEHGFRRLLAEGEEE